ncbi:MAG: MarR family transcriptional regulator [Spirochaetota bacterium]
MGTKYKGKNKEVAALDTFIKLTRATSTVLQSIEGQNPLPKGMNATSFGILDALYHLGSLNQQELGFKILKSKGSISTVIDDLERDGFVKRVRSTADKRYILVNLTKKGKDTMTKLLPGWVEAVVNAFKNLTSDEQKNLGQLCRKLGKGEASSKTSAVQATPPKRKN